MVAAREWLTEVSSGGGVGMTLLLRERLEAEWRTSGVFNLGTTEELLSAGKLVEEDAGVVGRLLEGVFGLTGVVGREWGF